VQVGAGGDGVGDGNLRRDVPPDLRAVPELKFIDVFICKLREKRANASAGHNTIETVWAATMCCVDPPRTTSASPREGDASICCRWRPSRRLARGIPVATRASESIAVATASLSNTSACHATMSGDYLGDRRDPNGERRPSGCLRRRLPERVDPVSLRFSVRDSDATCLADAIECRLWIEAAQDESACRDK